MVSVVTSVPLRKTCRCCYAGLMLSLERQRCAALVTQATRAGEPSGGGAVGGAAAGGRRGGGAADEPGEAQADAHGANGHD